MFDRWSQLGCLGALSAPLMVVVMGCSRKEAAPTPQPAPSIVATAPAPQAAQPAAKPPIATAEGQTPGSRIEVTELKRSAGGTVTLKFTWINESDRGGVIELANGTTVASLIDPVGKKKYFVALDSESKCVCSGNVVATGPRTRQNVWAKFPAPPDDVERISVVIPGFAPMDDAPLGR